jgi:hypothetical protein
MVGEGLAWEDENQIEDLILSLPGVQGYSLVDILPETFAATKAMADVES